MAYNKISKDWAVSEINGTKQVKFLPPESINYGQINNEWLKHGYSIDVMYDNGKNGDRVAGDGVWSIVKSLSPGRYEYKFVVDRNSWTRDPNAFDAIDDGYGGKNSVVIVK